MPEEIKTAIAGAEPAKDDKTAVTGAEPVKDAKPDSSTEQVPFDKDPRWKAARLAEKKLNELMKANEVEDPDDLIDLIQSGRKVYGKKVDLDKIEEYADRARKLEEYEAYWAQQEELKKRQQEDPDSTVQRLEKELKDRRAKEAWEKRQKAEAEEAAKAVKGYENAVKDLLEDESIPKERKSLMAEFLGIGNQANEIDITDKRAVRKVYQDAVKKFETFEQAVIQNYLAGKSKVPVMTKTDEAVVDKETPIKTLKDARKVFAERMAKLSGT